MRPFKLTGFLRSVAASLWRLLGDGNSCPLRWGFLLFQTVATSFRFVSVLFRFCFLANCWMCASNTKWYDTDTMLYNTVTMLLRCCFAVTIPLTIRSVLQTASSIEGGGSLTARPRVSSHTTPLTHGVVSLATRGRAVTEPPPSTQVLYRYCSKCETFRFVLPAGTLVPDEYSVRYAEC